MEWRSRCTGLVPYLTVLGVGYALAGWSLAAYGAPALVWVVTLMSMFHLAQVGPDAIALSLTWVMMLLWGTAYLGASPQEIAWTAEYAWGLSLLLLWVLAVLLVLLLAFAGPYIPYQLTGKGQTARWLVLLSWGSLGVGVCTYQLGGVAWIH